MLINEKKLSHWIDNFYGYGSWDAKVWLIAYEESGGEAPEEVAEKINYFHDAFPAATGGTLCDIRQLCQRVSITFEGPKAELFPNRFEYRFGNRAVLNGIWKNLITFKHACQNEQVPDLLAYQKDTFASPTTQNETLISLYPLPGPHSHSWYYSWVDLPGLPFLKSRQAYEEHVYRERMRTILSNMGKRKPELVLMYGMNQIQTLKKSIQESFEGVQFKMIKAIPQQIPQHHRADIGGTTILITTQIPALRHNRPETGFDWGAFGRHAFENARQH